MSTHQVLKNKMFTLVTLGALLCASVLQAAENTYYRYKNKDGVTVMNSAIPPEYVQLGYEIVTVAGDVLEVVKPAPTKEELERTAKQREREAQLAEWDESLLKRYSSSKEIEKAKDRKVADFQGSMSILKGNANNIKNQIETVQARAANIERAGRAVPKSILNNLNGLDNELKETERLIGLRLVEQQKIEEKFNQDIERFKEISPEPEVMTEDQSKNLEKAMADGSTKETANITD
ncbi:MAG: hypothetical protein K6L75_12480 [Cellvibrionaceae bacterium]